MTHDFIEFGIQMFAEGAAAGAAEGAEGAFAQPNGVNDQVADGQDEREVKFNELIKGEYKDLYGKRVEETVKSRLKSSKETIDKFNALSPTLEMLGAKYGVNASDVEALNKAIQDDDSYYEQEAFDRGLTVSQLKEIKKLERENAQLLENERRERTINEWQRGEAETQKFYPNFSFEVEVQNPDFLKLISNGIPMQTAYEVIHKDDLLVPAMQMAADKATEAVRNSVMSNGMRPKENGLSSQASSLGATDVQHMSSAQIKELQRRVANGETIVL